MVFGRLCWIRGQGSPGSGAYLRGIGGSFLATGMASAAIMTDSLVKGIGPAVGAPRFPGALLIQKLPIPSRTS